MSGERPPVVSVGIPAYNAVGEIRRTVESVINQTWEDWEVVIADNCSTDGTEEACRELAATDPRIRYFRNPTNIGLNKNFRRVLALSRGRYFRWLGVGDWLGGTYLEECVPVLAAAPKASLVTTYQRHIADDGRVFYDEYSGPRPSSPDPVERLLCMLRLLLGSLLWIDPIYSLTRRSALDQTRGVGSRFYADELLACELALSGPFVHLPECLAYRQFTDLEKAPDMYRRLFGAPSVSFPLRARLSVERDRGAMILTLLQDVWSGAYTTDQKLRASVGLADFGVRLLGHRSRRRLRRMLMAYPVTDT